VAQSPWGLVVVVGSFVVEVVVVFAAWVVALVAAAVVVGADVVKSPWPIP